MLGTRQKLLVAASEQEVNDLLNAGLKFEFASKKTVNGWKSAARRRLNSLKGTVTKAPIPTQESVEEVVVTKKRSNKRKSA
jgi:hypothetical protein